MKKTIILLSILLTAGTLLGQVNYQDTNVYSPALDKGKMVRIYLPPGYAENYELYYPVVYFLHGWGGNHTSDQGVLPIIDSMVRTGKINLKQLVIPEKKAD